jgi:hypothetical protein
MLVFIAVCVVFVCICLYYLMRGPNVHVVVARYKEDTSWTKRVKYPCLVYDKENPENPYNVPVNKGHEASVYFKYIIDHYDKLPDYVVFVHGHEKDWHHPGSIVDTINSFKFSDDEYTNINVTDVRNNLICNADKQFIIKDYDDNLVSNDTNDMYEWWRENMEEFFGPPRSSIKDTCCAQFVLPKSSILKHPLRFYQKQYNWLITTDIDNHYTGRFYEWVWKFVFSTDNKCVS